jgi:uncharacterized protein (DUF433 family)
MAVDQSTYQEHIVQDPAVMAGRPVIKGTRIPVERVIAHLAHNPDVENLFAAYPELTVEDVQAALHFAHARLTGKRPRTARALTVNALAAELLG